MDVESFRIYLRKYSFRKISIQKKELPKTDPTKGAKDSHVIRSGAGSGQDGHESKAATG